MDVEQLIQAADLCKRHIACDDCEHHDKSLAGYNPKCFHNMMNQTTDVHAEMILAVRDHYKAEGRAEGRAEVIREVREWITTKLSKPHTAETSYALEIMLGMKLDELAGEDK